MSSLVIEKYWQLWSSDPFRWVHSDILCLKASQSQSETLIISLHYQILLGHLNLTAFFIAFEVSASHWISNVKFWYVTHQSCVQLVLIDQVKVRNASWLTKLKASETSQVISRMAFELWLEEVLLVDVKLVVQSVDVVWLNGFLKVLQWLKVGNLSESEHIVVEEFHSASWPSDELVNNNSDWLGVNSSEINGNYAVMFKRLWTVAVDVLVDEESVLDSDPFHTVSCVFKVERLDFGLFDEFQLKSVESHWVLSLVKSESSPLSLLVLQGFPSFCSELLVFKVLIFEGQAWIVVLWWESWAAEELAQLWDWGQVVNVILWFGDVNWVNVEIVAFIFTFQLHSKFLQTVAFSIEEWVLLFTVSTIFSVVLNTANWVREANELVQEESGLAWFTNTINIVVAVWIHLLTLIVSVKEEAFSAGGANWHLICSHGLGQAIWFLEHAFSNAGNEIFFSALVTVSFIIVVLAIDIVLNTIFICLQVISNWAQDTFSWGILWAVLNFTNALWVHLVRISASQAAVWKISFGFGFLKFLTVWNGALSVDFLERSFAVLTFSELVNAAWLSDSDDFLIVIIIVLDKVSTGKLALIIWAKVITWGALFLDLDLEVPFIQTLVIDQPVTPSATNAFQALVLSTVGDSLDVINAFSGLLHDESSQSWALFAFSLVIGQTSRLVWVALSVWVQIKVFFTLKAAVSVLDFAFGDEVDELLGSGLGLDANTVQKLVWEFAIIWLG